MSQLCTAIYFIMPDTDLETSIICAIETSRKLSAILALPVNINDSIIKDVFDLLKIKNMDIATFHSESNGLVFMKRESIDISGFHFTKSPQSKYFILDIQ